MSAALSLRLRNDFNELPGAATAVEEFLAAHSAPPDATFAANLAIEELVTNIIKYGYDDQDPHEIAVDLAIDEGVMKIEIGDGGHEFNPFDQPEPDTSLPAEERSIGGLGIHFVRNMLDSHEYVRANGRNIVRLSKKL